MQVKSGVKNRLHAKIRAHLYLRAILTGMEDLASYSQEARDLTRGWHFALKIGVIGGPSTTLVFDDGMIRRSVGPKKRPFGMKLNVRYATYNQFNRFFEGKIFFPPLFTGNLLHLFKLKKIGKLAALLTHYLKPEAAALEDRAFLRRHAQMTLHALIRSTVIVSGLDPIAQAALDHFPEGLAVFGIEGQEGVVWVRSLKGQLLEGFGQTPSALPDVRVIFSKPEIVCALASQKLDTQAAIGKGLLRIEGFAPLADSIGLVMERVGEYL
ncbi:MAG: hypothetical protein V1746_06620 [bacterium]